MDSGHNAIQWIDEALKPFTNMCREAIDAAGNAAVEALGDQLERVAGLLLGAAGGVAKGAQDMAAKGRELTSGMSLKAPPKQQDTQPHTQRQQALGLAPGQAFREAGSDLSPVDKERAAVMRESFTRQYGLNTPETNAEFNAIVSNLQMATASVNASSGLQEVAGNGSVSPDYGGANRGVRVRTLG